MLYEVITCKEIKALFPELKIVALTSYTDYSVVKRMMANGASGYVIKNAMPDDRITSYNVCYTKLLRAVSEKFYYKRKLFFL